MDIDRDYCVASQPKRAILLAAGVGRRMIPIDRSVPKALLEVHGEPLIERLIKQLHEKGIDEIYVVVGFMKEKFEYLVDAYHVHLSFNPHYFDRDNLYSLYLCRKYLFNAFIVPCDLYFEENPFDTMESHSWHLVIKGKAKQVGLTYLTSEDALKMNALLETIDLSHETYLALLPKLGLAQRMMDANDVYEVNTYEDLRTLDDTSMHLKHQVLSLIGQILQVDVAMIQHIRYLKKGMTNHSFIFEVLGERYIMRIPGKGTDRLMNRKHEKAAYDAIAGLGISDDVIYFNADNGYKLTKYLPKARNCDAYNVEDLKAAMTLLKSFHDSGVTVKHRFDLFKQIEYYEKLRGHQDSMYKDYEKTKQQVYALKHIVDQLPKHEGLTHLDAIADNF